jgi:hypothetical protein
MKNYSFIAIDFFDAGGEVLYNMGSGMDLPSKQLWDPSGTNVRNSISSEDCLNDFEAQFNNKVIMTA